MNRLQHETSPYLLQHADNPVDWFPWKQEAFDLARRLDKPILVSIGYSTCHWCHVMERESFEKEAVAAFMNAHFVNIKVDREERPDVDQIYMEACQAIHGSGGWPLNCFLTPDGRPFFAGTYYPPQPAHNRPSWLQLLQRMAHSFSSRRKVVEEQADQLTRIIRDSDQTFFKDKVQGEAAEPLLPGRFDPDALYANLRRLFDTEHGGFGGAPKFPSFMSLDCLLQLSFLEDKPEGTQHTLFSLKRMIRGGIYDQLGGGLARYATDRSWLVPHFEKMLYDNGLLLRTCAAAYQVSGEAIFRQTIEETSAWLEREMRHAEGGYFAALDADSEGEEGKFYVWTENEIDAHLGAEGALFKAFYGLQPEGNWEGRSILWRPESVEAFAGRRQLDIGELAEQLANQRAALLAEREKRVRPGRDEKVLLSWNALVISGLAKAAIALGPDPYLGRAESALRFLLDSMRRPDGGLWHVYNRGQVQYSAFLDDYSLLIEALIDTYEAGFDPQWLQEARQLCDRVIEHFDDPETGLFFFTDEKQSDLIARKRELYDSAQPSGNATMALNLLRLSVFFGEPAYRERAQRMLAAMADSIMKYPTSFSRWAAALLTARYPIQEIAVLGEGWRDEARALQRAYLPNRVLMAAAAGSDAFPLLKDRGPAAGTLVYVCRDFACQRPVPTAAEALKLVNEST